MNTQTNNYAAFVLSVSIKPQHLFQDKECFPWQSSGEYIAKIANPAIKRINIGICWSKTEALTYFVQKHWLLFSKLCDRCLAKWWVSVPSQALTLWMTVCSSGKQHFLNDYTNKEKCVAGLKKVCFVISQNRLSGLAHELLWSLCLKWQGSCINQSINK